MSKCTNSCYGCKNCQAGIWTLDTHVSINDGTLICTMTGNVLVDDFDREINNNDTISDKNDIVSNRNDTVCKTKGEEKEKEKEKEKELIIINNNQEKEKGKNPPSFETKVPTYSKGEEEDKTSGYFHPITGKEISKENYYALMEFEQMRKEKVPGKVGGEIHPVELDDD